MASGDTLFVGLPDANEPPTSNFATNDTRNSHPVLDFDTTTQETAIWSFVVPQNYTAAANVGVYVRWAATSATTGTIGWDATFETVADSGQDIDADGFATAQTITAATVSGTSGVTLTTNVAVTAGANGTDSFAAGDLVRLRIRRDVANDSAAGDAELLSVEVRQA